MKLAGRLLIGAGVVIVLIALLAGTYSSVAGARTMNALEGEKTHFIAHQDEETLDFGHEYDHVVYVHEGDELFNYCIGKNSDGVADELASDGRTTIAVDGQTWIRLERVEYQGPWQLSCSDAFMVVRADYDDARVQRESGPANAALGASGGVALALAGVLLLRIDAQSPPLPPRPHPGFGSPLLSQPRTRARAGAVLAVLGFTIFAVGGSLGYAMEFAGTRSFEKELREPQEGSYVVPRDPTTMRIESGEYYQYLLFPEAGPAGCRVVGPGDFMLVFSARKPNLMVTDEEGTWSLFREKRNFRANSSGDYSFDCGAGLMLSKKNYYRPVRVGRALTLAGYIGGALAVVGVVLFLTSRTGAARSGEIIKRAAG